MDFIIGFISNNIATILCHPIDVVKTRSQTTCKNRSIYLIIQDVCREKTFFRGLSLNLGTLPIFWGTFFQLKRIIKDTNIDQNLLFNKFIISYMTGNIASLVANPLFVVKTRMQTSVSVPYSQIVQNIYYKSNIRGFYTGYIATTFNNIKLGIQFPCYEYLIDQTNSVGLSSFISKCISTSIMYPFDLVRVQQRNSSKTKTVFELMKYIHNREGFRGIYRGLLLYNCVSIPNFVIMMYGIEYLNNKLSYS